MPFHNRIDRDLRVVYVEAVGEITIEALIANLVNILEHPDYRKNYNMLIDKSKAKPHHSVNLDKVKMSKEYVEEIQKEIGNCKWAVYAPDDDDYSFSHMFEVISTDLSIETRVFRDRNEAERWLGVHREAT